MKAKLKSLQFSDLYKYFIFVLIWKFFYELALIIK